ncbi:hypothetical protein MKX03_001544, partial [Papaver bracteatum]
NDVSISGSWKPASEVSVSCIAGSYQGVDSPGTVQRFRKFNPSLIFLSQTRALS